MWDAGVAGHEAGPVWTGWTDLFAKAFLPAVPGIIETNRIRLVLLDMQNSTLGSLFESHTYGAVRLGGPGC
jgi:hypothetical protein